MHFATARRAEPRAVVAALSTQHYRTQPAVVLHVLWVTCCVLSLLLGVFRIQHIVEVTCCLVALLWHGVRW